MKKFNKWDGSASLWARLRLDQSCIDPTKALLLLRCAPGTCVLGIHTSVRDV